MLRHLLQSLAAIVVALALFAGTATAQTVEPAAEAGDLGIVTTLDSGLVAMLAEADLLAEWTARSGISPAASLVRLAPESARLAARIQFDAEVRRYVRLGADLAADERMTTQLESRVSQLDGVIATLAAELGSLPLSSSNQLTELQAQRVRLSLAIVEIPEFGAEAVATPHAAVATTLSDVHRGLTTSISQRAVSTLNRGTTGAFLLQLANAQEELQRVRPLLAVQRRAEFARHVAMASERQKVVDGMDVLLALRVNGTTALDGMAVEAFDAYLTAAESVSSTCPIDWALLAGIGRVESFHGMIDDTQVLASGRVSVPILGPLLDGGATEREAVEAARLAAEEAALLAELEERERLEAEAELAIKLSRLYGFPVDDEPDAKEETSDAGAGTDDAQGGDEASTDGSGDDGDQDADADDEELLGNGFAVIEDSDNGRLDGNDRWDRAVGPMQFIPETWKYMAVDGNNDGVIDPQNIYDAASSAARFLCRLAQTRGSNPQSFILGYNGSRSYVSAVMSHAGRYRDRSPLVGAVTETVG